MITEESLRAIEELGIEIDHDVAFGGKSKGNQHLRRSAALARYLAQKVGANVAVAVAGSWLHDTALPSGNDYDYDTNKEIVLALLRDIDMSQHDREAAAECVASHEGTVAPKSLEAQVVHDVDVLEKAGILGIIRHTWKLTNSGKIDAKNVTSVDCDTVCDHVAWRQRQLRTDEARRLSAIVSAPLLDDTVVMAIVKLSAKRASQGVITEKIAQELQSVIPHRAYSVLRYQLNQDYLKGESL